MKNQENKLVVNYNEKKLNLLQDAKPLWQKQMRESGSW